jgi:flagellar hook protein FlgE
VTLDLSKSTQLAADFSVANGTVDGSAPSKLDHITIGKDGTVTAVYANGITKPTYRIPLAQVESPDNLTTISGDAYQVNSDSGDMVIGTANAGGLGEIDSSSLEGSTVDLATELTSMISAQRGYEANSKVLQTTSDLLSIINNLKV